MQATLRAGMVKEPLTFLGGRLHGLLHDPDWERQVLTRGAYFAMVGCGLA